MNEQLGAVSLDPLDTLPRHSEVGERLPPVHSDNPPLLALAARDIDDELVLSHCSRQGCKHVLGEFAPWEERRRDDDLLCAGIEPLLSVGHGDAAADLESRRPRNEGLARRRVVVRA